MPERRYLNTRTGEERIEIEFTPGEIPELLRALDSTTAPGLATQALRDLLAHAQARFAAAGVSRPGDRP